MNIMHGIYVALLLLGYVRAQLDFDVEPPTGDLLDVDTSSRRTENSVSYFFL